MVQESSVLPSIHDRVSSRGNHFVGEAPGNGCGFICFSIQLSQILGGGGGGKLSLCPSPLDETLHAAQQAFSMWKWAESTSFDVTTGSTQVHSLIMP